MPQNQNVVLHDARDIMSKLLHGQKALEEMSKDIKRITSTAKWAAEFCHLDPSISTPYNRDFVTGENEFSWWIDINRADRLAQSTDVGLRCFSLVKRCNVLFHPSEEQKVEWVKNHSRKERGRKNGYVYFLDEDPSVVQSLYQNLPHFIIGMIELFPEIQDKWKSIVGASQIVLL